MKMEAAVMTTIDRWTVELSISEREGQTHATARLVTDDRAGWLGHGMARRNPRDPNVADIGEKIAVARALAELAHLLLDSAATELEDIIHQPARLHL